MSITVTAPAAQLRLRLQTVDLASQPITDLRVGQAFVLEGYVEDARPVPQGVFSAFLDVLYDATLVSPDGPIEYGSDYPEGQSGSTAVAGVINEGGAVDGSTPLGDGEFLLFRVPFHADVVGRIDFIPNEAEAIEHEVLVFGGSEPVPPEDIQFVGISLEIYHAPWQNPTNRFDVNSDGRVTPLDVLLVINEINNPYWSDGQGILPVPPPAGKIPFLDVNGDGWLGPGDVLAIINEINGGAAGGGEGEFSPTRGLVGWPLELSNSAAVAPLPAMGSTPLADPALAVRSTSELLYPALGSQGDGIAASAQAEADRTRAALLESLGGSTDEDPWEGLSPFELEETLDDLGADLSRALARRGGLLLV